MTDAITIGDAVGQSLKPRFGHWPRSRWWVLHVPQVPRWTSKMRALVTASCFANGRPLVLVHSPEDFKERLDPVA